MVALEDFSKLELAIAARGGPAEFRAWLMSTSTREQRMRLHYNWEYRARSKQLPPAGNWSTWMVRCGRGWGKTLTGAQWIRWRVEREGAKRIALVGATAADVRDVMVEGPSGILAISPPWNRPIYEPSKRRLTWKDGATATTFSADEPRSLRGPEYDTGWADELAHWQFLEEAWDNLQFGLRRGDPRCIVTSSPRGLPFLRALEAEDDTETTIGNTYENARNLPKKFLKRIQDKYEGTRLGRQEIFAEILTDNPRALWHQERIDELRVKFLPEDLLRLVIGVDPAVTANKKSDETGIVAAALAGCRCRGQNEMHAYVFEDASGIYKPHEWGAKVVETYEKNLADLIVAEVNNGGDLVERNLRTTDGGINIPYKGIHASKGKAMRHEPIANLCTQGKVHHVGRLSRLEDQLTKWDPTQGMSPDRADAYTIVLTELMLEKETRRGEVGIRVIG